MRIAVSGTHSSGKTTFIEHFLKQFSEYESFDEPYLVLEDLGHEFSDPPTVEEYEQQLDCCLSIIEDSGEDVLFDQSPADFLGYAMVAGAERSDEPDPKEWVPRIQEALSDVDLVLFFPIEEPDVISVSESEDAHFRLMVDERLKEIVLDDSLGVMQDTDVLEVTGTIEERVKKVSDFLQLQ